MKTTLGQSQHLRRLGVLVLLVMVGLGIGCSARKVAYNWADRFLLSALDDTFHLTGDQRTYLRKRLPGHLRWHRQQELPRYAKVLDRFIAHLQQGGSDPKEVEELFKEVEGAVERVASRISPDGGLFLAMISKEQVAEIRASLMERAQERYGDLKKDEAGYIKARLKKAKKTMKTWTGEVRDEQIVKMEAFIKQNRPLQERRFQAVQKSRETFLDLLGQGHSSKDLADVVYVWMTKEQVKGNGVDPKDDLRDRATFITAMAEVLALLSPAQRQHLCKELAAVRDDLVELSQNR